MMAFKSDVETYTKQYQMEIMLPFISFNCFAMEF